MYKFTYKHINTYIYTYSIFKVINACFLAFKFTYIHTQSNLLTYLNIYTYTIFIHKYIYIYIHTGLEIGGFASPNANLSWVNCESLWPSDLPKFFWQCESLLADYESLFKWIRKKNIFLVLTSFLSKFYI